MNLLDIGKLTEEEARRYFEETRWPNGPVCPHCNNAEGILRLKGKSTRSGLYKCGACRKQFTVTVGTVMHGSHLTIKQWLTAFHLMCSSKKGISALQLKRELGIGSYKSAWFLAGRIREAMRLEPLRSVLGGDVEVDETYIGARKRRGERRGRGTRNIPVVALISRDGGARSRAVERLDAKTLRTVVRQLAKQDSRIMTDGWYGYRNIGKHFAGGHEVVNHARGEYVRGSVHTNTVESYFALLKRGVHGIFHHVSSPDYS